MACLKIHHLSVAHWLRTKQVVWLRGAKGIAREPSLVEARHLNPLLLLLETSPRQTCFLALVPGLSTWLSWDKQNTQSDFCGLEYCDYQLKPRNWMLTCLAWFSRFRNFSFLSLMSILSNTLSRVSSSLKECLFRDPRLFLPKFVCCKENSQVSLVYWKNTTLSFGSSFLFTFSCRLDKHHLIDYFSLRKITHNFPITQLIHFHFWLKKYPECNKDIHRTKISLMEQGNNYWK